MRPLLIALLAAGCALSASAQSSSYKFAGVSWRQENVPDLALLLGDGQALGAAKLSAGLPDSASSATGFPLPPARNFRDGQSIGRLTVQSKEGPRALNLPGGNDGAASRHGVQLGWSGGRVLPNLRGPDFTIFESSTDEADLFCVRVRSASSQIWTRWYYLTPQAKQSYVGTSGKAYATGYDLSYLGIPFGDTVDLIQIVNMMPSDRIDRRDAGKAEGFVVIEADPSANFAEPALFSGDSVAGYDPDILYCAVAHQLITFVGSK